MPTQDEAVQALLERQKKAGAVVKPLSEAPAEIQEMAAEDAAAALGYKLPGRRPTPVWRVLGGGEFRYDDGEFACTIGDIRLDVFLAFSAQLQLYAEAVDADKLEVAFTALARAYMILYHRPRCWRRWFRSYFFLSARRARNKMVLDLPARAIYTFLPAALAAYHSWVIGAIGDDLKKKSDALTPDTPKPSSSSLKNLESA